MCPSSFFCAPNWKGCQGLAATHPFAMKHRIVHALQKYLLNPPIKLLFALSIGPAGYALLETIGRKTGKPRRTPVGNRRVGAQFWIAA